MTAKEFDDRLTIDLHSHMASGRASITNVEETRREPFKAPDLIIGDVSKALLRSYFSQNLILGANIYRVRQASVTAEGMIFTDGRINISLSLNVNDDYVARYHDGTIARFPNLDVITVDEPAVLLTGPGHLVYGHWLVDFLPKLYLLDRCGYRLDRLFFLLPSDTPSFAFHWLELLGIHRSQFLFYDRLKNVVVCSDLIVPGSLRFSSRASFLFSDACKFLRKRILRNIRAKSKVTSAKVYLTRSSNSSTHNHRILSERASMMEGAQRHGFDIVTPENMNAEDQFMLFLNVRAVAGEYGSALHNAIFSLPQCLVLAARDDTIDLGFLQSGIGERLGHVNGYVIGASKTDLTGVFSIDKETIDLGFEWLSDMASSRSRVGVR